MSRPGTYRIALLLLIVASALVTQAGPVAAQTTAGSDVPATTADTRPQLPPVRDTWYLDDQRHSTNGQLVVASDTPAAMPQLAPRLVPWRDAWYLEEEFTSRTAAAPSRSSTPVDLSPRTHDDWPLDGVSEAQPRQP